MKCYKCKKVTNSLILNMHLIVHIASMVKSNKYKMMSVYYEYVDFFSMGTLVVTVNPGQSWTDATVAEAPLTLQGFIH